jgi:hypothetical protein
MNQNRPGLKFFSSRLFPFAFILAGSVILFFGLRGLCRAWQSVSWPVADGLIRNSTVAESSNSDGEQLFSASIRYQFEVVRSFRLRQCKRFHYNGNIV